MKKNEKTLTHKMSNSAYTMRFLREESIQSFGELMKKGGVTYDNKKKEFIVTKCLKTGCKRRLVSSKRYNEITAIIADMEQNKCLGHSVLKVMKNE